MQITQTIFGDAPVLSPTAGHAEPILTVNERKAKKEEEIRNIASLDSVPSHYPLLMTDVPTVEDTQLPGEARTCVSELGTREPGEG